MLEDALDKHIPANSAFKPGKFHLSVLFFQNQSMEGKLI